MITLAEPVACAHCGNLSDTFMPIDTGMRVSLQESGQRTIPEQVCASCFESFTNSASQGLKLRMERDLREKNKMLAWKNRVVLIKNARLMMQQKAYSEAAIQYEKYLRVLELVYNLKKGELSPAVFNNSSRSKELTVITSVYWDLVRIYDTSPKYGDRMQGAANKLAEFLRFSPMYADILRKADNFARSCKNPKVMQQFLRSTRKKRGQCFVATAVYAPTSPELRILRDFRDQRLRPYWLGRQVIFFYYLCSPPLATWLSQQPRTAQRVRGLLTFFTSRIKKNLKSS